MKNVNVGDFQIVGIAGRTNNAKEMAGKGIIAKQWERFFKEGILEKIPNKVESTVYAVYTDYESNRTGEYTFFIGAKVKSVAKLPAGLVVKIIPTGNYAMLTSDKGAASKVVPGAWKKIWDLETSNELRRAYEADFEVYDQRAADPQNSQVDVYVGTKQMINRAKKQIE